MTAPPPPTSPPVTQLACQTVINLVFVSAGLQVLARGSQDVSGEAHYGESHEPVQEVSGVVFSPPSPLLLSFICL